MEEQAEEKPQGTRHKEQETNNEQPATSEKRRLSYKEKREFDLLEKEIADLNAEKATITRKFAEGNLPYEELQRFSQRIGEIAALVDAKEMRWLELSEMREE